MFLPKSLNYWVFVDRIHVFHEGKIRGELAVADYRNNKDEAQELIMKYATGN